MGRFVATTIAFALLTQACSSSYRPARSPRIAVIQEGGMYTLVRDGQSYSVGLFGGGLDDAVEGNPAAEDHASTFKTLTVAGWSLYAAGLASSIAGIYVVGSENRVGGSGNDTAGIALGVGGLTALVASLVLIANAQPHLWDAVNTYNDGVDASLAYRLQLPPPFTNAAPVAPVRPSGPSAAPSASAPAPTPSAAPPVAPAAPSPAPPTNAPAAPSSAPPTNVFAPQK